MITQAMCTVFKSNLLSGLENFAVGTTYTYKIALYTADADLSADTLVYSTTHEVVGTGYTAGGEPLTVVPPASSGTTAFVSFANVTWDPASFACKAALIYNASTNAAVAVLDFGEEKTAVNSFTVTFPTANATTAIVRIA